MFLYIAVFCITITNGFSVSYLNEQALSEDVRLINFNSIVYDIKRGSLVPVDKQDFEECIPESLFFNLSALEEHRRYVAHLPIMGPCNNVTVIHIPKGSSFTAAYGIAAAKKEELTPENIELRRKMEELFGKDLKFEKTMPGGGFKLLIGQAPKAKGCDLGNITPNVKYFDIHGDFFKQQTPKDILDAMKLYNLQVHCQCPQWRSANIQTFMRQCMGKWRPRV